MTLRVKLLSILGLIIIISLMINTAVYNYYFERHQKSLKQKDIARIATLLQRDIELTMLSGKPETIPSIIENYSRMDNILSLRILNEEGIILKSMHVAEIGLKSTDYLQPREMLNDRLYYVKTIESTSSCQLCHGEKKILGIIEMKYDLSEIIFGNKSLKRIGTTTNFIIFSGAFIASTLIITWLIFNPLKKIISLLEDPGIMAGEDKQRDNEMGVLLRRIKLLIQKFKGIKEDNKRLNDEISVLKTEIKYKQQLEEINRDLQYNLKELESTNKALHLVTTETKKRLNLMEINIGRLKKTGNISEALCTKKGVEEVTKSFIKYIVDMLSAERGIIYVRKKRGEFIFHYIRNYGFTPELNQQDEEILSRNLNNGRYLIDIHPLSGNQIIIVPVKINESIIGALFVEGSAGSVFGHHDVETVTVFSDHLSAAFKNIQEFETFSKGYTSVVEALVGDLLEENRFYRKGRVKRLKRLSVEIGRRFQLSSRDLETLEQLSALCDIGKLRIPYRIFNKKGPLTVEEFNILKLHPIKGAELFDGIMFSELKIAILQHHERYDGDGYPDGIKGEDIDIKARIINLTDSFEAMMNDRPYRPALSFSDALKEIEISAGSQFDPEVVKKFFEIVNEAPQIFIETGYRIPEI